MTPQTDPSFFTPVHGACIFTLHSVAFYGRRYAYSVRRNHVGRTFSQCAVSSYNPLHPLLLGPGRAAHGPGASACGRLVWRRGPMNGASQCAVSSYNPLHPLL